MAHVAVGSSTVTLPLRLLGLVIFPFCFAASELFRERLFRFSAQLPLYQGVAAFVGADLQVFFYVKSNSSLGVYGFFHFVFDCSTVMSVSEGMCWVSFTVDFQVSGVFVV